jgi:ketosteroid isomerase-like protein
MKISAAVMIAMIMCLGPAVAQPTDDEAKIRALENQFAAAVNAKDVDAIMKAYVPDETLLVFDVVPPRQYVGAKAYRKDWEDFLALFNRRRSSRSLTCRSRRLTHSPTVTRFSMSLVLTRKESRSI